MSKGENAIGLSKTYLLKSMQCPKALYLSKNPPSRSRIFIAGRCAVLNWSLAMV